MKKSIGERTSASQAVQQTQKARDGYKSATHVALFAMEDNFRLDILMLLFVAKSCRHFAEVIQKVLVGPEAEMVVHVQISLRCGIFWETCTESAKVFLNAWTNCAGSVSSFASMAEPVTNSCGETLKPCSSREKLACNCGGWSSRALREYMRGFIQVYD